MLIIRPSFKDYCNQRYSFDEMAVAPTSFRNDKGEMEGNHHVSINNPLFMDTYDIYYLYQFPPSFWSSAFRYRYNQALHDAKLATAGGKSPPEIQDVTLTGQVGQTITFKGRNMFIDHLIDKIERAVDVDHFRKSTGSPEDAKRYGDESVVHKQAGRDLGGMIGASLAEPKKKTVTSMRNGKEVKEDLFVSRGFMGINYAVASELIQDWMKRSSEGWLKDLDKYEHSFEKIASRGGRGGAKTAAAFQGGTLKKIQQHMEQIGAKPFEIVKNRVFWPDVIVKNKKGETTELPQYTGSADTAKIGEPLPVLFPGRAIDSRDVKAYEADRELADRMSQIGDSDLRQMNSDLDSQIQAIEREIEQKDLNGQWDTEDLEDSKERNSKMDQLFHLKSLNDFKHWMKQSHPNVPLTPESIKKVSGDYAAFLKNKMKQTARGAKSYGPYEWNIHKYNRERHGHDPMGVGMSNPLFLGKAKYKGLRDKTRTFGGLWPNRQSKDMLHGPPGHWEDNFKSHFGHGMDKVTGDVSVSSHLSPDDFNQLEKSLNDYYKKIAEKLSGDPEVLDFLGGSKSDLMRDLYDAENIKTAIKNKLPDLKIERGYINDTRVPAALQQGYNEMKKSNNEFVKLKQEATTGKSTTSAIADGVNMFLNTSLPVGSDIQTALIALKPLLIMNAENFVRRTAGDSAFANYMDARKKSGVEKHQAALDLRAFVAEKAHMYAATVAQLDLGEGIETRRRRGSVKRARSTDAEMGTDGGTSLGAMIGDKANSARIDQQMLDDMLDDSSLIKDFENSLFSGSNVQKSGARRHRQASDATAGTIGHSLEAMYQLIDDAHRRAENATQELGTKTKSDPTAAEADMMNKITGAAAYFQLFKALVMRDAVRKGHVVNDKEAAKIAKERTIAHLKKSGSIPVNFNQEEPEAANAAQNFKHRLDNDMELDQDEREAAAIISSWQDEGLTPLQINTKLNDLETQAKTNGAKFPQNKKRIIDLILVAHGRSALLGTLEPTAMAASATGDMLPDVDLPANQTDRVVALARKVQQQVQQMQAAKQKVPPKPMAPVPLPQVAKPAGIPAKTGLGSFMNRPRQ